MRFLVRVSDGTRTPWSHRVAWYDYERRQRVCVPFLLHWPIHWWYRFWTWTYRWRPTAFDRKLWELDRITREKFIDRIRAKDEALRATLDVFLDIPECGLEPDEALKLREICELIKAGLDR